MSEKRRALGRGLAALIPGAPEPRPSPGGFTGGGAPSSPGRAAGTPRPVGVEEVHPWREQPRRAFDDGKLSELADSIRSQGVIQPLLVRPREAGGYELIDGERRWRAAQRAGLHEVPVNVRDVPPEKVLETALVANLQREDLNPIEQAAGLDRLVREFGYTQEELATRLGKDRTTVANLLRLLKLPAAVRELVVADRLSMGHARAILGLETAVAMERLARRTASQDLSVRQVEALVKRERARGQARAAPAEPTASARDLALRLQRALGAQVRVVEAGAGHGRIEIHYHSLDQLDAVLARLLP